MHTNLLNGEESSAQVIEPAVNPEDEETPKRESKSRNDDSSDNDLTPPKKNNYMYMEESDEEDDEYGYGNKDDYYNELGEGEIDLEEEGDFGEGEGQDGTSHIDQLKKVLMQMKGEEAPSSPDKSKDSLKEEVKKETPIKTPKQKPKPPTKGKSYREDEEKAPFTPLCEIINPEIFDESDSSEDEGLPDYRIGGYHPVHVGEVFLDRYIIVQKLGWGHFSTVWLTKDLKFDTFVALKVQKSSQNYLEAAYDEVEILDVVSRKWETDEWQRSLNHYHEKLNEFDKSKAKDDDCY